MSAQLKAMYLDLDLLWVPRDQNEEADALANREFAGFDPSKRIVFEVSDLEFKVLPRLMMVSEDLHEKVKQIRGAGVEKPKRVKRRP